MKKSLISQPGFSIVELLITIVIVAILASVSVAAYSGVQQRSRDSIRVHDMSTIIKALEMYKIQTGNYPAASSTNTIAGWEASSVNPSQFLSALKSVSGISTIPVDPINSGTTGSGFLYRYYRYTAGTNGCDIARGDYYVLVMGDAETTSSQLAASPGFQCSSRNWSNEGGYTTGAFVK